jgi:hypothetical protein
VRERTALASQFSFFIVRMLIKGTRGKTMHQNKTRPKVSGIRNRIIEEYQPKSIEDMQNALKDIFGLMFESMLKGEMNHHLGYESNDKGPKRDAKQTKWVWKEKRQNLCWRNRD